MQLPRKGMDSDTILATLDTFKMEDLDWRKGRTWAYVYPIDSEVEKVSKQAYMNYLTENALDPTVFPSCLILENQIVAIGAAHLGGDEHTTGNFTTGGTESILMAVKCARDRARDLQPEIKQPEMILPVTAHAAFHKAAKYFDVTLKLVDVDPTNFRAGADAVREAITGNTILIVASAPSYAHGVVDDVEGIAAVAKEHNILCHVDGCMGGWLLPYFKRLGAAIPNFDFSVEGVTSISMDLHKYAFCPKGASLILYRNKEIREYQMFSCSNWTGYTIINPTFQSTKTGGPLAGAWATMHSIGDDRYLDYARTIWDSTQQVIEGCRAIPGIEVMGQPDFCLVAIKSDEFNIFHLPDVMRKRGWYIQPQLGYKDYAPNVHFSINLGVAPHTQAMLADLREAVEEARKIPDTNLAGQAHSILNSMNTEKLSDEAFEKLLNLAGIKGSDLPESMAGINEILDSLPVETNELLLKRFFGNLNHLSEEQREMLDSVREAVGASDGPQNGQSKDSNGTERPILGLGLRKRAREAAAQTLRTAARVAVGVAALGHKTAKRLEQ